VSAACAAHRGDLAAYLVGALPPGELAPFQAHLDGCPGCRRELAELAPLPGLLARVAVEDVIGGPVDPGPALLDRLLAAAAREGRVRRVRRHRWLAAAAATALIGTGIGAALLAGGSAPAPTFSATNGAVRVTVRLVASTAGTQISLAISGVPRREHCELVAVSRTGAAEVAGGWVADYEGTAHIEATTAIPEAQLSQLRVETTGGQQIVALPV